MERLEDDLRTGNLSERSRGWLEFANIPANLMAAQLDPLPVVNIRQVHLYQSDHRGMPVALINREGQADWRAEYDPWGELLSEENPHKIEQPLRLPGQWYDEESGLHYNRHRYYDPAQGRYITQDPIGLRGAWNLYQYPLDPIENIDPLGLVDFGTGFNSYCSAIESAARDLPREEVNTAISNLEGMKNAYNPLQEYAFGIAVGAPEIGLAGLSMGVTTVEKATTKCISSIAQSIALEEKIIGS